MKMYVSINCKGEMNPFLPAVGHTDKSIMEKFVTEYNNHQCEIGATDTDDMAVVEEMEIENTYLISDPTSYWEGR